jgi:excinuclease UvrABC nuclease subunit
MNGGEWQKVAGLYIFAYFDGKLWRPVYIGKTEDFSSRLPNHERWDEALQIGATHVHALAVPLEASRDTWERRLIEEHQPLLNEQYRRLSYLSMLNRA